MILKSGINIDKLEISIMKLNYLNNEIKKTKQAYYKNNLESNKGNMKKTWNLINELSSRNVSKTKRITQLDFEEREITAPEEIAETFNSYFLGIGEIFLLLCVIQHFILNQLINLSLSKLPPLNC